MDQIAQGTLAGHGHHDALCRYPDVIDLNRQDIARPGTAHIDRAGRRVHMTPVQARDGVSLALELAAKAVVGLQTNLLSGLNLERRLKVG